MSKYRVRWASSSSEGVEVSFGGVVCFTASGIEPGDLEEMLNEHAYGHAAAKEGYTSGHNDGFREGYAYAITEARSGVRKSVSRTMAKLSKKHHAKRGVA